MKEKFQNNLILDIMSVNENGTIDYRIDRAIVVAWHRLNEEVITPKNLDILASNFLSFISTAKKNKSSVFLCCDDVEKKIIKKIILRIVEKNDNLLEELSRGDIKSSVYLTPLEKNFRWGENLILLAKDFGVEINTK